VVGATAGSRPITASWLAAAARWPATATQFDWPLRVY